jgi:hypothetical protein
MKIKKHLLVWPQNYFSVITVLVRTRGFTYCNCLNLLLEDGSKLRIQHGE